MRPPRGVNFSAFDIRLRQIWRMARSSAQIWSRSLVELQHHLQALALGAQCQQTMAVLGDVDEPHRLLVQLVAAGLDARQVEDLVDELQEVAAAVVDVAGVLAGSSRSAIGPSSSLFITSEKPRMALSGVRSSWLMVARKRDLATLAASARRRASSEIDFSSSISAISASFSARNSSIDERRGVEALGKEYEVDVQADRHGRHRHIEGVALHEQARDYGHRHRDGAGRRGSSMTAEAKVMRIASSTISDGQHEDVEERQSADAQADHGDAAPGHAADQLEPDELSPPLVDVHLAARERQELATGGDHEELGAR